MQSLDYFISPHLTLWAILSLRPLVYNLQLVLIPVVLQHSVVANDFINRDKHTQKFTNLFIHKCKMYVGSVQHFWHSSEKKTHATVLDLKCQRLGLQVVYDNKTGI